MFQKYIWAYVTKIVKSKKEDEGFFKLYDSSTLSWKQ